MTDEKLASRIVGRWPSGAPVNRVPDGDDKKLGENSNSNNYFRFDSDAAPLPLVSGRDPFPQSKADPAGIFRNHYLDRVLGLPASGDRSADAL